MYVQPWIRTGPINQHHLCGRWWVRNEHGQLRRHSGHMHEYRWLIYLRLQQLIHSRAEQRMRRSVRQNSNDNSPTLNQAAGGLIACFDAISDRDGGYSEWQSWSNCSTTCGTDGTRSRSRLCDNPTPQGNGATCAGDSTEAESCNVLLVSNQPSSSLFSCP